MKQKLYDAFVQMTAEADPGKVQAAVLAGMTDSGKRKLPGKRILRIAAACAAMLVLSVTVYAAAMKYLTVQVSEGTWHDFMVHIDEEAGSMITLPAEKMEELQKHIRTQEDILNGVRKGKTFDSWQEAADWLDCGLLVSELLSGDDVKWNPITLIANPGTTPEGESVIWNVSISGSWNRAETNDGGYLSITIPLSGTWDQHGIAVRYGGLTVDENGRLVSDGKPTENTVTVTEYTTVSGIPVEITDVLHNTPVPVIEGNTIIEWDYSILNTVSTSMHFLHGGIIYDWDINTANNTSSAELAKAIADSLQ